MWKKVLPLVLSVVSLIGSVVLLSLTFLRTDSIDRTGVTTIEPLLASELDAGVFDAGASDAGPEKVRPTAEQLSNEFLVWELRDLEKQASTPEDKLLIRQAIDLKNQRLKKLELSDDFNANMKRALK